METKKSYIGIDCFRLIAAFLVIAIHTAPLTNFGIQPNYLFTMVWCRVAVPFFFMTSGFFLISGYSLKKDRLVRLVRSTLTIYLAAILIYLPLNIYRGDFRTGLRLPELIKDFFFDGTFYHLWYLPAAVIGAVIAWYLVRKVEYSGAFAITGILYLIALFGDSYYGIAEKIPLLQNLYQLLFRLFDYTRNGFLFAPVFFVLGGWIADRKRLITLPKALIGLAVSFFLMTVEGLLLDRFGLQRFYSMYVFLLPVMYFLFSALVHFRGKQLPLVRDVSMIVYIVHPWMIVAVRWFAEIFHLEKWLVNSNLVHFIAVCVVSFGFSFVAAFGMKWIDGIRKKGNVKTDRSYIELDLNALQHNVEVLNEAMPSGCRLMAVVKAEAYGHGADEVVAHLQRIGVDSFAVATLDEGIHLRKSGIKGEILILGYSAPWRAREIRRYHLMQTLIDEDYAEELQAQGCRVKVQIKVDTGMHRLGFDFEDTDAVEAVFHEKRLQVCGIYTHLCASDSLAEEDEAFTRMQIDRFYGLLHQLEERGISLPKVHIQSSSGLLNYPELQCDYVRAGVALYGVFSSAEDPSRLNLDLQPVLSLKSRVVLLRKVPVGDSVGYSRQFVAQRESTIAILPIGYADGYPRNLSCGKGYVLIGGRRAPIVGKICMDQMAVDVTDLPNICVGTSATLIGREEEEEILATDVAGSSESITNELLSRMGRRLKIVTR